MSVQEEVVQLVTRTHEGARDAAILPMGAKERILKDLADRLRNGREFLQEKNRTNFFPLKNLN